MLQVPVTTQGGAFASALGPPATGELIAVPALTAIMAAITNIAATQISHCLTSRNLLFLLKVAGCATGSVRPFGTHF